MAHDRHGRQASNEARERAKSYSKQACEAIAEYVCRYPDGVTSEEIRAHLLRVLPHHENWPAQALAPRIWDCKEAKEIMAIGVHRGRQVLVKFESQMSLLECA